MNARIGHVHLKVRDLDRAVAFYERFLGLSVREGVAGRYAFMSGGDVHHELALQRVPESAPTPGRYDVGLFHVAFELPDKAAFGTAYRLLTKAGVPTALVDHRISWAMYFSDPDGNGLEIYCDMRADTDGATLWAGEDRSLAPETVLALADSS